MMPRMRLPCQTLTRYSRALLGSATVALLFWVLHTLSIPKDTPMQVNKHLVTSKDKQQDQPSTKTSRAFLPKSASKAEQGRGRQNTNEQHLSMASSSYLKGHFNPAFSPEEKANMLDLVSIFDEVCTFSNITYFLYGGSLLGSYRHHDLIPWDDDIDVMVDSHQMDLLISELTKLLPEYQLFRAGPRLKFFWTKSSRTSEYPWNWPYLDVSFFMENDTHIWDTSEEFRNKYIYPKSIVFPLHKRPLSYLYLNSPNDAFKNLKLTYGSLNCESHYYSHKHEKSILGRKMTLPCKRLKHVLGFVYRSPAKGGIKETLKIGQKIIHTEIVAEPSYAITRPFTYDLYRSRKIQ